MTCATPCNWRGYRDSGRTRQEVTSAIGMGPGRALTTRWRMATENRQAPACVFRCCLCVSTGPQRNLSPICSKDPYVGHRSSRASIRTEPLPHCNYDTLWHLHGVLGGATACDPPGGLHPCEGLSPAHSYGPPRSIPSLNARMVGAPQVPGGQLHGISSMAGPMRRHRHLR